ncbi:MAG: hypothetical protein IKT14_01465 [Clostridiales bacterium]|nr:hypothetical protein [Clostridiales bacterium]
MRYRSKVISLILVVPFVLFLVSCGKDEPQKSYKDCLGKYSYDSPVCAMVYEPVEGEDGAYGIQYREVTDFEALKAQQEMPLLLYFYSSTATDHNGITAGVEDLAQTLDGQILVVAVDSLQQRDIVTAYGVEAIPEFVISSGGNKVSAFEGQNREVWSISDVTLWISENGYTPDMTKLE